MPFVKIRISVTGFTEAEARDGLVALLDELRSRSWIVHPAASWDADRARLVVTTHYEGTNADFLSRAASDEVWDCVIACVSFSSDGIHFEIDELSVLQYAKPDAALDPP